MDEEINLSQFLIRSHLPLSHSGVLEPLFPVLTSVPLQLSGRTHNCSQTTEIVQQSVTFTAGQADLPCNTFQSDTPYMLEAKTYSPGILRSYRSSASTSSALTSSSKYESVVNNSPSPCSSFTGCQPYGSIESDGHHLHLVYSDYMHELKESNMSSFLTDDAKITEGDEFAGEKLSSCQHITVKADASHRRATSQEKGLIAMGMDSRMLKNEYDQSVHRRIVSSKPRVHTSPCEQRKHRVENKARSGEMPSSWNSSPDFTALTPASETFSWEGQVFAEDYHAMLTDQYLDEKAEIVSESDIKTAMRMIPAPLFFKKSAAKHKRTTSGKSNELSKKYSSTTLSLGKGGIPTRVMSLMGYGSKYTARHRSVCSNDTSSNDYSPERLETNMEPLIKHRHEAQALSPSSICMPFREDRTHTAAAQDVTRTAPPQPKNQRCNDVILPKTQPNSREANVSTFSSSRLMPPPRKSRVSSPSPFAALLNTAADKAKESFSKITIAVHKDERQIADRKKASSARDKHGSGTALGRTRSQKRRDEMKKNIRIVGGVDPNAAAVAEKLGAVELGKLRRLG